MYCITPSNNNCTPLFFKADPRKTGVNSRFKVARRIASEKQRYRIRKLKNKIKKSETVKILLVIGNW